jgi:nicotinamide-nucleotide amidase
VAVAESCTGGLVCAALTEIPGSSEIFEAGYITYSNASKIDDLGVSSEVVETFGAVSIATAWAMARGSACIVERRYRGRDHRDCRARRRHSVKAGRNRRFRSCRARMPIRRRSSPTRSCSRTNDRATVRLQAALCALELLMP